MTNLETLINAAWEDRANLSPSSSNADIRNAVDETIAKLDSGEIRVAEKRGHDWITH